DVPCYIEVELWNRGENKQAERVLQTLRKGSQIYIEGHLKYDEWEDRNGGGKRSKLVVVAETFQYLDSKAESEARLAAPPSPRPSRQEGQQQPARAGASNGNYGRPNGGGGYSGGGGDYDDGADMAPPPSKGKGGSDDDIPF